MVWPLIIGAAASVVGGAISAKGSKDAAKTAKAGSDAQLAYNKESRDIARADYAPYRTAGYAALDELGVMTGLHAKGESFGSGAAGQGQALTEEGSPWGDSPWSLGWENDQYVASLPDGTKNYWDGANWQSSRGSAYGGGGRGGPAIQQRATGGMLYNVNELGPESVYSGGSYTRNANPRTMPPDPTGYVKPAGRAIGGSMGQQVHMGPMATPLGGWESGGIHGPVGMGGAGPGGKPGPGVLTNNPDLPSGTDQHGTPYQTYGGQVDAEGNRTGDLLPHQTPVYENGVFTGQAAGPVPGGGAQTGGELPTASEPLMQHEGGGPAENKYDFTTDPGYNFRFDEGQRMLERGAAARGGLLSGGFARKAIRYGQDYATGEFSNIYNRISNIAGLGQVGAQGSAQAAQYGGTQMGNAASQGALSSAYGQQGATNAWGNAANQIAQLPWDQVNWGGGSPEVDAQGYGGTQMGPPRR